MPQGLQVWNENGELVVDITDRLTRVLGMFTTPLSDGSIVIPEFAQGLGWYTTLDNSFATSWQAGRTAAVSISGTVLSWSYSPGGSYNPPLRPLTIIYGVY